MEIEKNRPWGDSGEHGDEDIVGSFADIKS